MLLQEAQIALHWRIDGWGIQVIAETSEELDRCLRAERLAKATLDPQVVAHDPDFLLGVP